MLSNINHDMNVRCIYLLRHCMCVNITINITTVIVLCIFENNLAEAHSTGHCRYVYLHT